MSDAARIAPAPTEETEGDVSRRAVVLGLTLLVLAAPTAFFAEVLWLRVSFVGGAPSPAPVMALFLLAAVAGTRWARRAGVTRKELLVIYAVLMVGAPLGHRAILFFMIPKVMVYYHLARANPIWETSFVNQIPSWWAPTSMGALTGLFEGKSTVPWGEWWGPLSLWGGFLFSLWVCSSSLLVLLQRQWIRDERLAFPVAQIPLELARDGTGSGGPGLFGDRVFWLGLVIAFGFCLNNALAARWPTLPSLPAGYLVWRQQPVGPLAGMGEIWLIVFPWMFALVYLVPKEISFSTWFFWVWRLVLSMLVITAGGDPGYGNSQQWLPSTHQATGAAIALGLLLLWIARRHLARLARVLLGLESAESEPGERLLYRGALIALVASLTYMLWFCLASGCRAGFALALIALLLGHYVVWARMRAEVGMAFANIPLEISDVMALPTGYAAFRPQEILTAVSLRWAAQSWSDCSATLAVCASSVLESLKIAESARINKVRLCSFLLLGFLVSLVAGSVIVLTGLYHYGYFGTEAGSTYAWPGPAMLLDGQLIYSYLAAPPPAADLHAGLAVLVGAAATVALSLLRGVFWWWPLHPIGFLIGNLWGAEQYLFMFFGAWLSKVLVVRYGGLKLYRRTVPLAMGLIVGDLLNSGLWAVVALVSQGHI